MEKRFEKNKDEVPVTNAQKKNNGGEDDNAERGGSGEEMPRMEYRYAQHLSQLDPLLMRMDWGLCIISFRSQAEVSYPAY